ncbi:MAG TPA: AI-2E family transporter [Bacteroidales bacterium]|nr:AI-2E family transporter [Bacteroidales bacterium]
MKQVIRYAGYVLLLFIIGFLIWRFYFIIVWVLIAAVLSFIGQPLVKFFDRLHFKRLSIPHTISTLLSLMVIVLVFLGLLAIFVPLIVSQAETISKIDVNLLAENLLEPLQWLDEKMHAFGVIPAGDTLQDFIVAKAKSVVNLGSVTTVIGNVVSAAGNIFIGLFSLLFIAFFFLKEENMFEEGLLLFVPVKHHDATHNVIADSKNLLKRYFIGVLLEILGVMALIAFGLWIFGVENALLIGFFGGIMNIIPYLGPIIGSVIGITLGLTATLASGSFTELLPVLIKLAGVFLTVNFIDNNILVPLIYSKSVKSHPLEIFLIIIMGGSLAGLLGMLLAVPVYTVLRVIAKEFFQKFRVVQKLTGTIDQ